MMVDKLDEILFGTTQKNQTNNADELDNILFSQPQQTQVSQPIQISTQQQESSPISLLDRMRLSFADDRGRQDWLKQKYQYVQKLPNGKYAVGNDVKTMMPIDPEGVFNDVLGDMADIVGEIPVIAGQILGTVAGGSVGGVPGAIAGSAGGVAGGELLKTSIGRLMNLDQRTANELATDIAISSAFGAAGEGLATGSRVVAQGAKKVLAPKLVNLLAKGTAKAEKTGKLPIYQNALKKIFRYIANVPEESTETFFKYGMNEMNNPAWFDDAYVNKLVKDFSKSQDIIQKTLGKKVSNNVDTLINTARRSKVTNTIDVSDLFQTVKQQAQAIGILDDFGRLQTSKTIVNSEDIRPLRVLLNRIGKFKDGKFIQANKSLSVKDAVQMSRAFGDKFGKLSDNAQSIIYTTLNGNKDIGLVGLRDRITQKATELGVDDFAKANARYSRYLSLLDDLKLQPNELSRTETYINKLEKLGQIGKSDLFELDKLSSKISKTQFLKSWELWNAAQDFAKTDLNVLRFGAIAGILGSLTGFQSSESKVGTIAGAALFGTPAGLRQVIRLSRSLGYALPKQALQKIGIASSQQMNKKYAGTILSQLLKAKSKK